MGHLTQELAEQGHDVDELEIGQSPAEFLLMAWPYKRRRVTRRDELRPVQGGAEDTDERVMTSYTEMCDGCDVHFQEEGHDVERVTLQSDVVMQTDQRKKRPLSRSERSRSSDSLKDHLAEEVHDQPDSLRGVTRLSAF